MLHGNAEIRNVTNTKSQKGKRIMEKEKEKYAHKKYVKLTLLE